MNNIYFGTPALLDIRVSQQLKVSLKDRAKLERKSVSKLVREILFDYLTSEK